jgi:hypothetical protein
MPVPIGVIVAAASELAKISLQGYFQYARMSGMTPEEIDAAYTSEKARFEKNAPSTLPEPPDLPGSDNE